LNSTACRCLSISRTLLVIAIVAPVLASTARAQLAPADSFALLHPSDGFEVELWASEPDVNNPTSVDVDSRGRVWIAEGQNYRLWHNRHLKRAAGTDRIKIVEDADGDGRADRVTVFAENVFPVPMGIAIEELYDERGDYTGCRLYVGNSPDVLVLEDTDGDDRADRRFPLLTGFGGIDSDHGVHGMTLALDGRLYFTHGDGRYGDPRQYEKKGDVIYDVVDRSGRRIVHRQRGEGTVLVVDLDGTHLEILATGFRNNYGACVDSWGHPFISDNDDDGRRGCRTAWVLPGGHYGYRTPVSSHHWAEDLPGIVPKLVGTGNGSPGGIVTCEGAWLGERYEHAVLQIDAVTRQVNAHPLTRVGAALRTEYEYLLRSEDAWSRPIDAAFGPDGALYVVDWYDAGVGGNGFADRTTGRVFRLARKGKAAKRRVEEFGSVEGLARALASPVMATRFAARQSLARRRDSEALRAMRDLVRTAAPHLRARALHAVDAMGASGDLTLRQALSDADPRQRELALRLMTRRWRRSGPSKPFPRHLLRAARDADAGVRRELLTALRHARGADVESSLADLAASWDGQDRHYLEALRLAFAGRSDAVKATTFARLTAAAVADRTALERDLALPPYWPVTTNDAFLRPSDRYPTGNPGAKVIGLAWALEWDGALPSLERLLDACDSEAMLRGVEAAVARSGAKTAGRFFARRFLAEEDAVRRRELIGIVGDKLANAGDAALEDSPVVAKALTAALADPDLEAAGTRAVGRIGSRRHADRLVAALTDASKPESVRAEALAALGRLQHAPLAERARVIVEQAKEDGEASGLALAALRAWASLSGSAASARMAAIVRDEDHAVAMRRAAMRELSSRSGYRLLDLAKASAIPDDLRGELIALTHHHPDSGVRVRAREEIALPPTADGKPLPTVADLLVRAGDARRGRDVFFRTTADAPACSACHRAQGRGLPVGPDLSTIGTKLGKDGLLEAILNPSGAVAFAYQSTVFVLADGRVIDGIVVEESPTALVLRDARAERLTVATADVLERRASTTSLMPDGLTRSMTAADLVDLLAYLETLRLPAVTAATCHVLGPLSPAASKASIESIVVPELDLDVAVAVPGRGELRWNMRRAGAGDVFDFGGVLGATRDEVIFGHVSIESPSGGPATIVLATALDAALWLDGKRLRTIETDADATSARVGLKKGANDVVFQLTRTNEVDARVAATVVSETPVRLTGR